VPFVQAHLIHRERDAWLAELLADTDHYRHVLVPADIRGDLHVNLENSFHQRRRGTGVGHVGRLNAIDEDLDRQLEYRDGRADTSESAIAPGGNRLAGRVPVNRDYVIR